MYMYKHMYVFIMVSNNYTRTWLSVHLIHVLYQWEWVVRVYVRLQSHHGTHERDTESAHVLLPLIHGPA